MFLLDKQQQYKTVLLKIIHAYIPTWIAVRKTFDGNCM